MNAGEEKFVLVRYKGTIPTSDGATPRAVPELAWAQYTGDTGVDRLWEKLADGTHEEMKALEKISRSMT